MTEVHAEMVAQVWKIVAHAGESVAVGDTLVILESMKMEIPVLAEIEGLITEVCVAEGDVVHEGDTLVILS